MTQIVPRFKKSITSTRSFLHVASIKYVTVLSGTNANLLKSINNSRIEKIQRGRCMKKFYIFRIKLYRINKYILIYLK